MIAFLAQRLIVDCVLWKIERYLEINIRAHFLLAQLIGEYGFRFVDIMSNAQLKMREKEQSINSTYQRA